MNKQDEWAFWLMRSIIETDSSTRLNFYDTEANVLFTLAIQGNKFVPVFRNSKTEENDETIRRFEHVIKKVETSPNTIIQLPRLTLQDKKNFLIHFVATIPDKLLKQSLETEINNLSENDEFDFKTNLKIHEKDLYLKFDLERGQFIFSRIRAMYWPLGVSEESEVVW